MLRPQRTFVQNTKLKGARAMDRQTLIEKGMALQKAGGPFIGPRGGKWADPQHTIPWEDAGGGARKTGPATAAQQKKKAAREQFQSRFSSHAEAVEFFEQVLSIGKESLPKSARTVLAGGAATPAYYGFLASQMDADDAGDAGDAGGGGATQFQALFSSKNEGGSWEKTIARHEKIAAEFAAKDAARVARMESAVESARDVARAKGLPDAAIRGAAAAAAAKFRHREDFANEQEAMVYEGKVLASYGESLPPFARDVRDGRQEPGKRFWEWMGSHRGYDHERHEGTRIIPTRVRSAKSLSTPDLAKGLRSWVANKTGRGGEGTRGGKIIGHTASGKPIYDSHDHVGHAGFTEKDHHDAAMAHRDLKERHHEDYKTSNESNHKIKRILKKVVHHEKQEEKHSEAHSEMRDARGLKHESDYLRAQVPHHEKMVAHHQKMADAGGHNAEHHKTAMQAHAHAAKTISEHTTARVPGHMLFNDYRSQDNAKKAHHRAKSASRRAEKPQGWKEPEGKTFKTAKEYHDYLESKKKVGHTSGVKSLSTPDLAKGAIINNNFHLRNGQHEPLPHLLKSMPDGMMIEDAGLSFINTSIGMTPNVVDGYGLINNPSDTPGDHQAAIQRLFGDDAVVEMDEHGNIPGEPGPYGSSY